MVQSRIAVVGAGVIGLACGVALARRGASVCVFEASTAGSGATTKAAGMLGFGHELARQPETALFRLGGRSLEAWPGFARELEDLSGIAIGFDATGTISCAFDEAQALGVQRAVEACAAAGFPVELLDGEEALDRELALGREPLMAAWLPDAQVDPLPLVEALKRAFTRMGGDLREGVPVGLITADSGLAVQGEGFDAVVLASGASALPAITLGGEMLRLGLPELTGVRGLMLALQAEVGAPRHVVRSGLLYIAPKARWTLVGGATLEQGRSDNDVIDALRADATQLVGGLALAPEVARWDGLRPSFSDGAPVLGETAVARVFAALGAYRHGVLLVPAIADIISSQVLDRTCDDLSRAFSARRFDKAADPSHPP